jgi:hypothetical protein
VVVTGDLQILASRTYISHQLVNLLTDGYPAVFVFVPV